MRKVYNVLYGASGLGMMWGFIWSMFMKGGLAVMVVSMVVGAVTMFCDDEKED